MPIGLKAGDTVNVYVVEKKRGSGGQATVYAAHHSVTGVRIALKVSHIPLPPELHERWIRDAKTTKELECKHLARALDAGVEDGIAWAAWEYLDGSDLEEYIDTNGRQSPEMAALILGQICAGIRELHLRNTVHCDLTPKNIFLCEVPVPGGPLVKLLDFGLVKILTESMKGSTNFVAGSPRWMSPEQMAGRSGVDRQTDVWAFGLLAFYLLVGASFWEADNIVVYINRVLNDEPPTATERTATLGCSVQLPPEFDRWFGRCIAKDPKARFGSISDAWRDYQRVFDLKPDGSTQRLATPPARPPRRRFGLGMATGVLVLGAGLAGLLHISRKPVPRVDLQPAKPSVTQSQTTSLQPGAAPASSTPLAPFAPSGPSSDPSAAGPDVVAAPGSSCPTAPVRPAQYVLGGGTLQVAEVPYEDGRTKEETRKLAAGRLQKLGAILRARGAKDWLRTLWHFPGRDKRAVERVVFSDVAPQAGEAMCHWLQCENWQWGCDFVDDKGQRRLASNSFPERTDSQSDTTGAKVP